MGSTTVAGFASGIIIALAIMVGMSAAVTTTHAVISSIVVVAFVEGFSDSFSEYLSQRTDKSRTIKEVWKATAILFGTKFVIIIQFIWPFLLFPLDRISEATQFAVFWGLLILSVLSGYIAKQQENKTVIRTMALYIVASIIIVTITYYAGDLVGFIFSLLGIA
ncbi:MAG: hypothetical protein ACTSYB_14370 [Candidatus Helarchaeota archaeon]